MTQFTRKRVNLTSAINYMEGKQAKRKKNKERNNVSKIKIK